MAGLTSAKGMGAAGAAQGWSSGEAAANAKADQEAQRQDRVSQAIKALQTENDRQQQVQAFLDKSKSAALQKSTDDAQKATQLREATMRSYLENPATGLSARAALAKMEAEHPENLSKVSIPIPGQAHATAQEVLDTILGSADPTTGLHMGLAPTPPKAPTNLSESAAQWAQGTIDDTKQAKEKELGRPLTPAEFHALQVPILTTAKKLGQDQDYNSVRDEIASMRLKMDQVQYDNAKKDETDYVVQPDTAEYRTAQDVAYGKLTLAEFNRLYGSTRRPEIANKRVAIYDQARQLNPSFNPADYERGYKFATNPQVQGQLVGIDNLTRAIPLMENASDAASRSGIKAINQAFIIPGGIQIGAAKYSNLRTAQKAFGDELSRVLGFGSVTDMSRKMGLDMTDENLSPEAFKDAIDNIIVPFVANKRQSMLDQMSVYGKADINSGLGAAPATGGTKKTVNVPGIGNVEVSVGP
jgi:hypothetical protein